MSYSSVSRIGFFCALILCLSGCTSTTSVPPTGDTAFLPQLKWTVTKPATWDFLSRPQIRDFHRNFNSTNKTLNYVYYQDSLPPFLAVERKRSSNAEFRTILSIDRGDLGDARLITSEKALAILAGLYLRNVDGAEYAGPVMSVEIAGQSFTHGQIRYPLAFKDGRKFEVERHFWVKTSATNAIVITVAFDVKQNHIVRPEVDQMLASLVVQTKPASASSAP